MYRNQPKYFRQILALSSFSSRKNLHGPISQQAVPYTNYFLFVWSHGTVTFHRCLEVALVNVALVNPSCFSQCHVSRSSFVPLLGRNFLRQYTVSKTLCFYLGNYRSVEMEPPLAQVPDSLLCHRPRFSSCLST